MRRAGGSSCGDGIAPPTPGRVAALDASETALNVRQGAARFRTLKRFLSASTTLNGAVDAAEWRSDADA
jgi:hypothetical protein